MHTFTFSGKSGLTSRPWRAFLAFFTILIGMGASHSAHAQTFTSDNLTIVAKSSFTASTTTATYYGKPAAAGNTLLQGANLGTFYPVGSSLTITAASADVTSPQANRKITAVNIAYRVYASSATVTATSPAFTSVSIPATTTVNANTGSGVYTYSTPAIELIQGSNLSAGNYTLEVRFALDYNNGGNTANTFDPAALPGYKANFTISPLVLTTPAGQTSVWVGGAAAGVNNWLLPANWTNGVPTPQSDAIIPSRPNPQPYEPRLNEPNAVYTVRNLTLEGAGQTTRALLRITTATLLVYGDINNPNNGILATTDAPGSQPGDGSAATIILAGGDQVIDQGRFANVVVQNNTVAANGTISPSSTPAIKSVTGVLEIPAELRFPSGVKAVLRTSKYTTPTSGILTLDTSQQTNVDLKAVGTVTGETNTAFVLGVLKTDREVITGVKQSFGNIGIEITINGVVTPGRGFITRTVGESYTPFPDATNGGQPIPGTARSVKRIFGNSFASLQSGFNAIVRLHYQNSGALNSNANSGLGTYNELNGNPDGMLAMYRTTSNSTFQKLTSTDVVNTQLNSPYSLTEGYVEATGLNNINTLTLADGSPGAPQLPLPVVLAAFDAKRTGADALVTWTTASEKNSKGFYVEVSTDGKNFRSLGFVASTNGNSLQQQQYRFVDAEEGKAGNRYYRLHQVDVDGKDALSEVRAVNFGVATSVAGTTVLAYPNPFTSSLSVSVGGSQGAATLRLTDLTGRTLRAQHVMLQGETTTLALGDLSELKAGIYLVQLALPSGKVQHFKVQKL